MRFSPVIRSETKGCVAFTVTAANCDCPAGPSAGDHNEYGEILTCSDAHRRRSGGPTVVADRHQLNGIPGRSRAVLLLIVITFLIPVPVAVATNDGGMAFDEQTETNAKLAAERFLTVLLGNPRFGTAFDRVYEFHIDRGSIAAFQESLRVAAKLPAELSPAADSVTSDMIALSLPAIVDSGSACQLFGMIQLKHSEAALAVTALQQAAQQSPKDAVAHWYLAQALLMADRLDDSIKSLEQAIDCRPAKTDLLEIYKELARIQQRAQNPDAAFATWQRLENAFPGDLRVREQIAATLADDARWDEALIRFQALAKETTNPDQRVQANLSASDMMIQLGRSQDAVALLELQLSELDTESWFYKEIRRRIEDVFRSREDLPGLVAYYEAWIRSHPDDVSAMSQLARTLSMQNRSADASEWYRKAIQLAPSNVALQESLIEQLVRDNRFADAIAQYEQMAQFDAGNQDHIEDWGQLYLSQKDLPLEERQARAAAVWERLLVDRQDDPATLARLASLLRRAELRDRAISLYESAIEKTPNEAQYREYLGEYLHQIQRTDEAVATWKQIANGDRRSKANLIRLAEILNRFGQIDQAVESMREACSMNPTSSERMQFAEMLRNAAEVSRSGIRQNSDSSAIETVRDANRSLTTPATTQVDPLLAEALQQLDLAEQSAETPDERQQILRDRVQTLFASGQLEEQTKLLAEELHSQTSDFSKKSEVSAGSLADRWRTLALYQDAADQLNEATASAMKIVELDPGSVSGWTILADLFERSGRLGDAAEAMEKLASLDRRGISAYLRKIARFQIRLGQFDAALQSGREVIKATPGNPEAYQFFADLAFEVGQPQAAIESLRRAVRVNPGDEACLRALAKTLADEFQTGESIELYWRAFDKAADLESQTNIVIALSNLYLRSNQFEKLIARLELRGRELNLPTEMTRCIATAYREAGDFRMARVILQRLQSFDDSDPALLRELLGLALLEQNSNEAIELQKRISELTSLDSDRQQLATLLQSAGRSDESSSVLQTVAALPATSEVLLRRIQQLVTRGNIDEIITGCREYLKIKPDDWAVLTSLASLLHDNGRHEEAFELASTVICMQVPFDAKGLLAELAVLDRKTNPLQHRTNYLRTYHGLDANRFVVAWCRCCDILLLSPERPRVDLISEILSQENDERLRKIPVVFIATHIAAASPSLNPFLMQLATLRASERLTEEHKLLYLLLELDTKLRLARAEPNEVADGRKKVVSQLPQLILEHPDFFERYPIGDCIWQLFHTDPDSSRELLTALRETLSRADSELSKAAIAAAGMVFGDTDLLRDAASQSHPVSFGSPESLFFESLMTILNRTGKNHVRAITDGMNDKELLKTQATLACRHSRLPSGVATDIIVKQIYVELDHRNWANRLFASPYDLSPVLSVLSLQKGGKKAIADWAAQSLVDPDPLFRARTHLLLSKSNTGNSHLHLIQAAELLPNVPGLRFDVALEAADQQFWEEAIQLLDSLQSSDSTAKIAIETRALEWSLAAGKKERAKLAAKRLFGLPIAPNQQMQLASRLSQLGLNEELAALNARLGRGAATRQSVLARQLQSYTAQGNSELAGEVAWELLKLASGGSLFSGHRPNDDRDDGGERLQAIKALGTLQRLQPLIDRYEAMLAASPESVDLLEILAEFHEAAEQWDKLATKRDRIALLSKKAPPSLKAKAVALENSGDVNGACDLYLTILKDDPAAFSEEMETYVQAFERAKRHADFLTAVLSVDAEHWNEHAGLLINMIAGLARAKTNDEIVRKSIEAMLANESTRRIAIGGFLARPDVFAEEKLLPAIRSELESEDAFTDFGRCNETFLILQGLKNETSLRALHEVLIRRADGREPSEEADRVPEGSRPPLAEGHAQLLLLYLDARLGNRAEVERRMMNLVLPETADTGELKNTPSSGLAATFSPDAGEKGQFVEPFGILVLNIRLKELSKDWDSVRLALLEHLASRTTNESDTRDTVLEELGTVYESFGQAQKARLVLHQRVQRMLKSTGVGNGTPADSIRKLLQAGEKIQHSGFPIEGARLLLNVTPHDIDKFTSDLDDDKAIAFKSRFNASQRWARQQISAEKIVTWFETAVQQPAPAIGHSELDIGDFDLLLELSGTTDPRTHDIETLKQLRIDSVLLNAIAKQSYDSEELQNKMTAAVTTLLTQATPDVRLLGVALALSRKLEQPEHVAALCDRISASSELTSHSVPDDVNGDGQPSGSQRNRIPEALRSDADLNCVLIARLLASQDAHRDLVRRLLQRSASAGQRCSQRLVKIATLQECAEVAALADLSEESTEFDAAASAAITDQINATSLGVEGTIDLAHEIRTRLLKK